MRSADGLVIDPFVFSAVSVRRQNLTITINQGEKEMIELSKIKVNLIQIMEDYRQASKKYKSQTRELYNNIRHHIKIRAITTQECNCRRCRVGKQVCGYTINFVATFQQCPVPTSVQSTSLGVLFNWISYEEWPHPLGYGSTEMEALKHLLETQEKEPVEKTFDIQAPQQYQLH